MAARTVKKRVRFFLAGEGESEQSFVRWLQMLTEDMLFVHLDAYVLGGGGFKTMLKEAVHEHRRRTRKGTYRERFLIVDGDRADHQDWSIEKLRTEAAKEKFVVIVQQPKHEGLLYRMSPGKERDIPSVSNAETKLRAFWSTYQKPVNAHQLSARFTLADLARVARVDADIEVLLRSIGLSKWD